MSRGIGLRVARVVPYVVVGVLTMALIAYAAISQGFPTRQIDLNDTGIWVSNDRDGQFGRLNKAAQALDARLSPPGVRNGPFQLDIVQDGNLALGWDQSNAQLTRIDTVVAKPLADNATAVDSSGAVAARGGTLAVMNRAGQVWAIRYDPADGLADLTSLGGSQPPLTDLGLAPDAPAGSAALAVGEDGSIYLAGVNGRLVSVHPDQGGFTKPVVSDGSPILKSVALTVVGAQPVILDAAAGQLVLPGGRLVQLAADPAAKLQLPGPDASAVLVANAQGLAKVKFDSGDVVPVFAEAVGAPAAPVRLAGCDFGAWSGTGRVVRSCDGGAVEPKLVTGGLDRPAFRTNHEQILLNDQADGTTFDLDTNATIDWPQPKPPTNKEDQLKEAGADVEPKPKAVDDQFKVRPGRTSVLHVLDNDTDTVGGVLTVTALDTAGVSDGVDVEIAPDGQTVKVNWPSQLSSTTFGYTVSDGTTTATARVRVSNAGDTETLPKQRPNYSPPRYAVPSFGTLSIPVISDWRDDEADPITVVSAWTDDKQVVPVGPDGQLNYTADEAAQDTTRSIHYRVTDGVSKDTKTETLKIKVLGAKSNTMVAPVAQADSARGQVGQPITVYPLSNDTPGADPNNLNAKLTLAGASNSKAHLKVVSDAKSGRVTVTADQAGPYFVDYSASFGNAASATGVIRIDAFADDSASDPVAMPDQVAMHGSTPVLIDVLANDYDPSGKLLTVQSADSDYRGQLQVQVIKGRWLRILALGDQLSPNPQVVHYRIDNGSQTADGDVLVTQLPAIDQDQALPHKDAATVRVGDSVLIPVLANDTSLSGEALSLVTDHLGTDRDGQLPIFDRAKTADEDQGDVGQAYVHGGQVRYVAPATVDGTRQVVISYTAQTRAGDTAESQVVVTIKPEPSADSPDAAPVGSTVESRVVSGSRVRIQIPTSGQDPDGDTVIVNGITSAPSLGRVVAISPNTITYEAYPNDGAVGTDTFGYQISDKYGRSGEGVVRIAVAAPGQTQPPVAIDDHLVTKPGAAVQLNVMANDFAARDDLVAVAPLARTNNPVPAGVSLGSESGPLLAKAPELTEQPVVVNYALTGNGGTGPAATVTISSKAGFNNPPTATDQVAEVSGGVGRANLLKDAWDVDGPNTALKAALAAPVPGATVSGADLSVQLLDHPQVIPFTVTDSDGAVSAAVVFVPAAGSGAPQLKVDASIDLASDSTASFNIADYVDSPRNKIVRLASAQADGSPSENLDARVDNGGKFTLTSKNHYSGPAAVTFDVMDAASLTEDGVLTATVTIPVQVGARTPVLHCPQSVQTVVQGGEIKNLDITSLCHVWSPDPDTLGSLTYSASWAQPIDQVNITGGEHRLKLQAGGGAPDQGEGVITVGIEGTKAVPNTLNIRVIPADPPSLRSVSLTDIKAGTPVNVPIAVISPLLDAQTKVVKLTQTGGGKASTTMDQASVTITPDANTSGKLTFSVVATDLASDPGRESRWASASISMVVYARPDPPSPPQGGPTVQSRSATLSWSPGLANGAAIDGYELKIVSGPGAGRTISCRSTPCQVNGLANGKAVTFQVRAHNKADWSDWSRSSGPVIPDEAPGAPAWVKVSDPEDHSVLVSWGKIANNGSPIKTIYVTVEGTTVPVRPSENSVRVQTPSNNYSYDFGVAGENDYKKGPTLSAKGQSSGKPIGLTVDAPRPGDAVGDDTNVVVSWDLASPEGPLPVTYDVVRSGGTKICSNVTAKSCTDDRVAFNGASYTYTVTATNATGGAAHSTSKTSPAWSAIGTPDGWGGWSAEETGKDGQVKLAYTVPKSHGAQSTVQVFANGKLVKTPASLGPGGGPGGVTISDLENGKQYQFLLKLLNESGRSSVSSTHAATPFGRLDSPRITSGYATENKISAKAAGNGNGRTATLRLYIGSTMVDWAKGTGSLSVSGSRTGLSYSTNYTVRATLTTENTTPSRGNADEVTKTVKTDPKPPDPTLHISKGATMAPGICGSEFDGNRYCYWVVLTRAHFVGEITCHIYNLSESYLKNSPKTYKNPNGTDSTAYVGVGGGLSDDVHVTCDGPQDKKTTSNHVNW